MDVVNKRRGFFVLISCADSDADANEIIANGFEVDPSKYFAHCLDPNRTGCAYTALRCIVIGAECFDFSA